ncbi:MAG: TonB-dependent receptor [Sphingobacteriaceae bacterium]|nr:MAG: TonB-dependent receptor [Sphingobacteriaceae bacterium]
MKRFLLFCLFLATINFASQAQTLHQVRGTIQDSTGATLPGTVVKLVSASDTLATAVNLDGVFIFPKVKSAEFNLSVSLIGFQPLNRRYLQQPQNPETINVGIIKLKTVLNQLKGVTIVGTNPVRIKEDTVEFSAGAYKVRENAPTEDMIRKLPGVDVDKDGNITDRGKSVTKIRINGKDFMGGDVKSVTKNLPADVIESIQMIDDYGDQANLTGVKTGEPDRIININIRKDRNVGYSLQATAGDGRDALPATNSASIDPTNPSAINNNENNNRYLGTVNYFSFKGDRQISALGNINNTNINTFTYGGGGVARGGGGGFGGGGGGRGNALRGASTTTNQNGITDAHAIGLNFRDQWGKKLSVYGSYSFSDNLVSTISNSYQTGINAGQANSVLQSSTQSNRNINHRLTWNMEYKPDTVNYFKFTPTFSYGSVNTNADGTFKSFRDEISNVAYRQFSTDISKSPSFGATLLYNHKFPGRRNLSINLTASSAKTDESDNPTTLYSSGSPMASPKFQLINTNSRTNSLGANVSFLQPIGKVSYLEFNYNLNHSYTTSDKRTDTLTTSGDEIFYQRFSNNYNYTFTTNKVGLNYRVIEPKYNFTVGLGLQPAVLDGYSPTTNQSTHVSTLNFAPVAHFNYNFSRTQAINLNYNGSSSQPNFNYLQPVIDFSNALYPVQGNPNLIPEFNNNLNLRYNRFSFATGDILFTNLSFNQTNNKIVANSIQYPTVDPLNPILAGTYLTKYQNADGYYSSSLFGAYSKPWANRRYTLTFNANANYTNNIGYSSRVTYDAASNTETLLSERNVAKSLVVTPGVRFRTDITDIIDAELNTSYSINTINNSIIATNFQNTVARTLSLGLNGKNYLWKNYTVSYDYTKLVYNGYTGVTQKNPNILNAYVERRFLKANAATIRIAAYDLFNQNTGYTYTQNNGSPGYTVSNVNRLGRYYLLSFSLRLQKFAGKAPQEDFRDGRGGREGRGGRQGGGPPGGGGPPME